MPDIGSWLVEALSRRVEELADPEFPIVEEHSAVSQAVEMMCNVNRCAAIVKFVDGSLGILTDMDVLRGVVARGLDARSTRVGQLASRPLETVQDGTKVGEALALMASKRLRYLGVVSREGRLRGLLTFEEVLGPAGPAIVPIPRVPGNYVCPFCGSAFGSKEELSRHIDLVHVGLGLLEGNTSRW